MPEHPCAEIVDRRSRRGMVIIRVIYPANRRLGGEECASKPATLFLNKVRRVTGLGHGWPNALALRQRGSEYGPAPDSLLKVSEQDVRIL